MVYTYVCEDVSDVILMNNWKREYVKYYILLSCDEEPLLLTEIHLMSFEWKAWVSNYIP